MTGDQLDKVLKPFFAVVWYSLPVCYIVIPLIALAWLLFTIAIR